METTMHPVFACFIISVYGRAVTIVCSSIVDPFMRLCTDHILFAGLLYISSAADTLYLQSPGKDTGKLYVQQGALIYAATAKEKEVIEPLI